MYVQQTSKYGPVLKTYLLYMYVSNAVLSYHQCNTTATDCSM